MKLMWDNFLATILEWNFAPNVEFFLSVGGLILGTLGCAYLIFEYLRHGKTAKFLLFWAIGTLLLFWFRIPIIMLNAGVKFFFSTFDIFLAVTFPMAMVGLILLIRGAQLIYAELNRKETNKFLNIWMVLTVIFFGLMFIEGTLLQAKAAFLVANLFLFLPVRLILLYSIFRWLSGWWKSVDNFFRTGIIMMAASAVIGAFQHIIAVPRIFAGPTELWFLSIGGFEATFILEIAGMMLLLVGIFLVHRDALEKASVAGKV